LLTACFYGGSAWESNPPETLLAPHTGFEGHFYQKNGILKPFDFWSDLPYIPENKRIIKIPFIRSVPVNFRLFFGIYHNFSTAKKD